MLRTSLIGACAGLLAVCAPAVASRVETVPRAEVLTHNGSEITIASDGASTLAIAYLSPRGFELTVRRPGRGFSRPWVIRPLGAGDEDTEDLVPPKIAFGPEGTVLVAFETNDGTSPFEERVGPACCWHDYVAALRPDGRRLGPWPFADVHSIAVGAGGRMAVSSKGASRWRVRLRGRTGGWSRARTLAEGAHDAAMGFAGRTLVSVSARTVAEERTVVERREGFARPRVISRIDHRLVGADLGIDRRGGVVGELALETVDRSEYRTYLLERPARGGTAVRDLKLSTLGARLVTHPSGAAAVIGPDDTDGLLRARIRPPEARFGPWLELSYPGTPFYDARSTLSRGGRLSVWRQRSDFDEETASLYLAQTSRRGGRARLVRRVPIETDFVEAVEDRQGPIAALVTSQQRIQLLRP